MKPSILPDENKYEPVPTPHSTPFPDGHSILIIPDVNWNGLCEAEQNRIQQDKYMIHITSTSYSDPGFNTATLRRLGSIMAIRVMHGEFSIFPFNILI